MINLLRDQAGCTLHVAPYDMLRAARACPSTDISQTLSQGDHALMRQSQFSTDGSGIELGYPAYTSRPADWLAHAPFAFWLTEAHRPRSAVELGLDTGNSYFALLQAARTLGLETTFLGVSVAEGPSAAGEFATLKAFSDLNYGTSSKLITATLNDALTSLVDGTVDILHINAIQPDEISHHFDLWLPKMSDRGIVLLYGVLQDDRLARSGADCLPGSGPFVSSMSRVWASHMSEANRLRVLSNLCSTRTQPAGHSFGRIFPGSGCPCSNARFCNKPKPKLRGSRGSLRAPHPRTNHRRSTAHRALNSGAISPCGSYDSTPLMRCGLRSSTEYLLGNILRLCLHGMLRAA